MYELKVSLKSTKQFRRNLFHPKLSPLAFTYTGKNATCFHVSKHMETYVKNHYRHISIFAHQSS